MGNIVYAALTICGGILCAVVLSILYRRFRRRADETQTKLDDILLLAIGRPTIILILFLSVYLAVYYFVEVPADYEWILSSRFIQSIFIVLGAWVISTVSYHLVHIYGRAYLRDTETDVDYQVIHLLEMAAKYLVWFIAILGLLSLWEVDITPLIAAAGILGLAFALAAQDILSNFFGGAMITADKPFRLGDRVKVEGYVGDVVAIGLRSTRILTPENQYVTIPNSKIASNVVVNYSAPEARKKIQVAVTVAYGSDVEKVRQVLLEIGREAAGKGEWISPGAEPEVFMRELGASGISFVLATWVKTYNLTSEAQDELNRQIYRRFARDGIVMPYPQMDVHLKQK